MDTNISDLGWIDVNVLLPGRNLEKDRVLIMLSNREIHILGNREIKGSWLGKDNTERSVIFWRYLDYPVHK